MSFFKNVFKFLKNVGFICFLFVFSLFLTSFAYFNHKLNTVELTKNIEIYNANDVEYFSSFGIKQLNIDVIFKEDKDDNYLIMYANYYFDLYDLPIQLFELKEKRIVIISNQGEIFLERY